MHQAMPTDIQQRCDTIEECYEFMLSYAAQGQPTDEGTPNGKQLRESLKRALDAMRGMEAGCAALIQQEQLVSSERYQAFFQVLVRDAQNAAAAVDLVLAQGAISSQLIDNLNASIHLRALLADLFLITEILELRQSHAKPVAAS